MPISIDLTDSGSRRELAGMVESPAHSSKINLIGLDRSELRSALVDAGVPEKQARMRASQLWQWIYWYGHQDFSAMSNIAKPLRQMLAEKFTLQRPHLVEEQSSQDGTRKWLFRFPSRGAGQPVEVETVYIPESDRGTLCISSQVGVHANLYFLPYRHPETGSQSDGRRNPHATHRGA